MVDTASDLEREAVSGGSGWWRWVVGSVVLVPMLLAAGVYWLHQLPAGPLADRGNAVIRVAVVRAPEPAAEAVSVTVPSNPQIADFAVASAISEQAQPSPDRQAAEAPGSASPEPYAQQALAHPAVSRPQQAGAALRYQRLLLAHIERYQRYPGTARRDGLQGKVVVAFAMRRDGVLLAVSVKSSSGQPVLDEEAVETVRRAQPLPSIPSDLPEQLTIRLPVVFDLR